MSSEIYTHTLKTGKQIKVDLQDKEILLKYILSVFKTPKGYTEYVALKYKNTRKYAGLLHRIIISAPDEIIVDHKNGDGLDCTRENLRLSTPILNQQNRRTTKIENEVRGLFFRKDRGYWSVKIVVNKKQIIVGSFANKDDAIQARLEAEEKYFGSNNGTGTQYA